MMGDGNEAMFLGVSWRLDCSMLSSITTTLLWSRRWGVHISIKKLFLSDQRCSGGEY